MYFTSRAVVVIITAFSASTAMTTTVAAFLFCLDDIISRERKSFLFFRPAGGGLFRFVRAEVLDVDYPALSCFVSSIATTAVILCDGDGD